jgi:hypothetical protein
VKFVLSILLWFVVCSLVYTAAALAINPNQTGPLHLFAPVLVDDRVPKDALFQKFAGAGTVDGVILGSSRTLGISPRLLAARTGKRYFNYAVSAARMREVVEIYRDVLRSGAHPKHVLVGLDENNLLARAKVEERRVAIANGAIVPRLVQVVLDARLAFTAEYAGDMGKWIGFQAGLIPRKAGKTFDEAGGTVHRESGATKEQLRAAVAGCVVQTNAQIERYDTVSELQFAEIRTLLTMAAADHATVEFFTTPFDPLVAAEIGVGTAYPALREAALTRVARDSAPFGGRLRRISSDAVRGVDDDGWSDCVHYSDRVGEALVARLAATEGAGAQQ